MALPVEASSSPSASNGCAGSGSTAGPREPQMEFGAERLGAALAPSIRAGAAAEFCVALSGGLDSTVLLHAMAELARGRDRASLRAVHVDHGLQPAIRRPGQSPAAAACRAGRRAARGPDARSLPAHAAKASRPRRARRAMRALAPPPEDGEWLADRASSRRPARDGPDPAAARRGRRRTRGHARARALSAAGIHAAPAARFRSR